MGVIPSLCERVEFKVRLFFSQERKFFPNGGTVCGHIKNIVNFKKKEMVWDGA